MRFRKKPVVIEAFQMTEARRWDNSEWPEWLNAAWQEEIGADNSVHIDKADPSRKRLRITTREGNLNVNWDDWIIQGVKGELYPCKPDIFAETYEPVKDA